ncbi:MAG: restriction endonuclease subunit S [Planctomycetota bacterium]
MSPLSALTSKVGSGATPRGGKEAYHASGVPLIRSQNVRFEGFDRDGLAFLDDRQASDLDGVAVQAQDVLLNITGASIGRVTVAPNDLAGARVNQHVCIVRPLPMLAPRFLAHYLASPRLQSFIMSEQSGVTRQALTKAKVLDLAVPVPPVDLQHRIVAAIESHFSRLDATTATLERVQRNLERYRASVLKAAVEGRLVPTEAELAKKEGRSYEPASALLKRILAERRRRWEEAELAKLKAKGKPPTDDRWRSRYKEPAAPNTADLPELPEGWYWACASSLFWDGGYGTSGKCTLEGKGPAVLRIPNVQDQRVDLMDLKFAVDPDALADDGVVEPGDFLFIRTNGSVNLIGRGAVVVDNPRRECHFASYLIRLRLVRVEPLWRWFAFAWHTSIVRDQLVRDAASSAGQHNISLSAVSSYAIPLPPGNEQHRILDEVARLDGGVAIATREAQHAQDRIARLRQSILKWAFEGRLVAER